MSKPTPLSRVRDCLVIGGGISGCTVAYELARRGCAVTLLERVSLAAAASGRNMGLLVNEVEPWALRMMEASLAVYREVEPLAPMALRQADLLLLATEPGQLAATEARIGALRDRGVEVEPADAARLHREWPALAADLAGGAVARGTWLLDPGAATLAFAEAAREAGAELRTGVRVASVAPGGALTDAGRVAADAVVVATGPWLPDLVPGAAISAGRGWVLRTGRLAPPAPWIVEEMSWPEPEALARGGRSPTLGEVAAGGHDAPAAAAFALAPQPGGETLVGTSLSPSLHEAPEGLDMARQVARRALRAAPGLRGTPVLAAWSGLRPITPDGRPVAGRTLGGLWVHGGHGAIGMQAAPATARWLAAAMLGDEPNADLDALAPGRFPAGPGG